MAQALSFLAKQKTRLPSSGRVCVTFFFGRLRLTQTRPVLDYEDNYAEYAEKSATGARGGDP
jgi:hypothetical protein